MSSERVNTHQNGHPSRRFGTLWHHADFLKLWAGETVSLVGSQVTTLHCQRWCVPESSRPGCGALYHRRSWSAASGFVRTPACAWTLCDRHQEYPGCDE